MQALVCIHRPGHT